MVSTNNQNTAPKTLPLNSETLKTGDITESPVQDPQTGSCFEKFADALDQHMPTLSNKISKNIIDAMNTFHIPRLDKEERTEKRFHSSRAINALIPLGEVTDK